MNNAIYSIKEVAYMEALSHEKMEFIDNCLGNKNYKKIFSELPELLIFKPFFRIYKFPKKAKGKRKSEEHELFGMKAMIYDKYKITGDLPTKILGNINANIEGLDMFDYETPISVEFNPSYGFDYLREYYQSLVQAQLKDDDIWKIFLAGIARAAFYHNKTECPNTDSYIKQAISEFMIRRPEYFNPFDFVPNEVIKRKIDLQKKDGDNNAAQDTIEIDGKAE